MYQARWNRLEKGQRVEVDMAEEGEQSERWEAGIVIAVMRNRMGTPLQVIVRLNSGEETVVSGYETDYIRTLAHKADA